MSDGPTVGSHPAEAEGLVGKVRERYTEIAQGRGSCCGPEPASVCASPVAISHGLGYAPETLGELAGANLGLGCGAPIDHLRLQPGETAVDLGSGAGLDAFLAARQVGPKGRVIGVDMTPAMLEKARGNAARLGLAQVEFREGRLESLPLEDASADAVTSNCVINLVPDKAAVFREVARVLRPGGRLVISDILLDGALPSALSADLLAYVGCVSGALLRDEYFALVRAAGLTDIEVIKDADYVATLAASAPGEAERLLARTGIPLADVVGKVRSVTFRAAKPPARVAP